MNILLLLLNFLIPAAGAAPTTCTGGTGNDYGGMTCTVPLCSITADPSLGCDEGTAPPIPPPTDGSVRCYLSGSGYLDRMCNMAGTAIENCYSITNQGMTDFCNTPPPGYANPSTAPLNLNDGGTALVCYELATGFLHGDPGYSGFCPNILGN